MKKKQIALLFFIFSLLFWLKNSSAQLADELEFSLDLSSPTVLLPKIYKSNIDLSGRGEHRDLTWPQTIATQNTLDVWQAGLGFSNFYRLQYNLWEIQQLVKDKATQDKLLENYDKIIKKISDSGGIVILDLFGTPEGLGRVLDKNSPPHNLIAYKTLVKDAIRKLSCEKKYNIWYEVWNAPDQKDFFLGEKSEYLNLYRMVAEAIKELQQETKINIPLGGPSLSAWFRNIEPNNILTPERSLIYELIKYCYNYKLPLDFISWHAYSSDPQEDKQDTIYHKPFIKLIREWLTYFHFESNLPLIIDEWNFDSSANVIPERGKDAYIAASYIPARLKNMYEAGADYQAYFCLEDFGANKAGLRRNLGVNSFDLANSESKGYTKVGYNIFRMLNLLGQDLYANELNDEFVGVIATKSPDYLAVLIFNYIDPKIALNYLSRNIIYLNEAERKAVLNIVKSDRMEKILLGQIEINTLRLSAKAKAMLTRAVELKKIADKFSLTNRKLKISLKNLKEIYVFSKYTVDSKCSRDCEFKPNEEKDIDFNQDYLQTFELTPYSAQLLVFKKKPAPPVAELKPPVESVAQPEVKLEVKSEIEPETKSETKPEAVTAIIEDKPEIKTVPPPVVALPAEEKKDAEIK